MVAPLEGIKVLDFSIAVAAPLGGAMLADMGAEVIKIERIQGEPQRLGLPAGMDDVIADKLSQGAVDTASWIALNRGKEDLAIDVRKEKGKEIIIKLVEDADVILESFRPGVMDRLGLGYEVVSKINHEIIYCSFTGYGDTGPLAHRAGGDMWSQAMSGMVSEGTHPRGRPQMQMMGIVDNTSGILVAYAIMTALYVRERTGEGQYVSLNNLSAAMYLQFAGLAGYLMEHQSRSRPGREEKTGVGGGMAPPYGPYKAKDGDVLTIYGSDPLWPAFCKLLEIEHLTHDPRFENDAVRRIHNEELAPILDEAFSRKTRVEWAQIFREAKMRCDPCLTYEELCIHPQVEANEIIYTTNHPVRGEIKMLGNPIKLKKTPGNPQGPSPLLGEHTEKILLELGYTPEDVTELEKVEVVKTLAKKE
jgi:crotonobetainyl-CoA:carnitine CoA-transferase CaiB-like acyl-CoA transferase